MQHSILNATTASKDAEEAASGLYAVGALVCSIMMFVGLANAGKAIIRLLRPPPDISSFGGKAESQLSTLASRRNVVIRSAKSVPPPRSTVRTPPYAASAARRLSPIRDESDEESVGSNDTDGDSFGSTSSTH